MLSASRPRCFVSRLVSISDQEGLGSYRKTGGWPL
ncbi:hypothetical protein CSUI_010542 [Cystoisospora suis]|uniref:Uncharacterized protein n=1 Tax=Cystoisospora suis TaxID=483139 RepID=A0A2C6KH35_9APIC|nr:hypothetical protein CSUI_010542 [Cystoisospora suis]